jgi:hypothetical protein
VAKAEHELSIRCSHNACSLDALYGQIIQAGGACAKNDSGHIPTPHIFVFFFTTKEKFCKKIVKP